MRYRQIHLDFHTSGAIPDIGGRFDAADFARTFAEARVDAVNLFAKCHHGWSYHPTEVGRTHPHLSFDLLRAQLDALQEAGIRTPIYVSAVWDELSAREHPEWRIVSPDYTRPVQHGNELEAGWKFLDLSSPYLEHLCAQVEEVVARFPSLDGLWMDICFQKPSVSVWAQAGMEAEGLDWTDPEHRERFAEATTMRFFERIGAIATRAGVPVFYNTGHIRRGRADVYHRHFSHIEIEPLPTSSWGYEHFPVSARYVEPLGLDYLGMTGKFHHMWGEVGGYKKPEALVYECGAMLAQGARCSIGDHLHPTGATDRSTYAGVREAFAHVEAREPWARDSSNRAEIGLLSVEATGRPRYADIPAHHQPSDDGAVRLLLENRFTFDVLDADGDFAAYRLLILPDAIALDPALKARVDDYLAGGGRLLASGASGLVDGRFAFDVGAEWHGRSPHARGDFALPREELRAGFVDDPLFMYGPSERITVTDGESLGDVHEPYFDRSGHRFSGHLHTPSRPEPSGYAFGVEKGPVTWLAHPVFSLYHRVGAVAMVEIVGRTIERALGRAPMLRTSLPTAGRATLRRQAGRDVLHLLHATPVQRGTLRGDAVQPIQDIVTLHDIDCDIECEGTTAVRLVPENETLAFERKGDRVRFTVPTLHGHRMVELERGQAASEAPTDRATD